MPAAMSVPSMNNIRPRQHRAAVENGSSSGKKRAPPSRTVSHKFRAQDFVRRRENIVSIEDHYKLGKLLGDGQFGEVFEGRVIGASTSTTGNSKADLRAIKKINKYLLSPDDHEEIVNEFTTLKQMDHPNILKMYEILEDKEDYWMVTELCSGGELLEELENNGPLTEAGAALVMKQVLSCVHYCHSQKQVVHRDLKLENILLEEGSKDFKTTTTSNEGSYVYNPLIIRVIDFGLATHFTSYDQVLSSPVGSMHYIAPEVLECEYNSKCDIWSCGVIAFILLSGYAPFEGRNDQIQRDLIMMGNVSFDDPAWQNNNISQQAMDFVSYLMTYEPDKRPTAEQALQHPWIQQAHQRHAQQVKQQKGGMDAAVKCLENCRSFEASSKLKQATCAFVTSQLVLSSSGNDENDADTEQINSKGTDDTSEDNLDQQLEITSTMMIGEIFRAMDLDSDGRLSQKELQLGFYDFFGNAVSQEEVNDIFTRMDLSSTGYIDYSEFVIAAMGLHKSDPKHQARHQPLLQQAFERLLDHDGSGFISKEKLRQEMMPFYGEDVEDDIIERIIDQVDLDGDGKISWSDFRAMMAKTAKFVPTSTITATNNSATELAATTSPKVKKPWQRPEKPTPTPSPDVSASPSSLQIGVQTVLKTRKDSATSAVVQVQSQPMPITKEKEVKKEDPGQADATPVAAESKTDETSIVDIPAIPANDDDPAPPPPPPPSETPQSIRRSRPSTGPKARLISAMFEKNLEKNREMGYDQFHQYTRKQPAGSNGNATKRRLPRTRRVNFEELTKKATTKIDFDPTAAKAERNKEIEQLKNATPGRARERRASLASMFTMEKDEQKKRRQDRLRELENINRNNLSSQGRQTWVKNAFVEASSTRKLEQQLKEQRTAEVQRIRGSLSAGEDGGTKTRGMKLFELFKKQPEAPKGKPPTRFKSDDRVKKLKEMHERQQRLGELQGFGGAETGTDKDAKTPFFRKMKEQQREEQLTELKRGSSSASQQEGVIGKVKNMFTMKRPASHDGTPASTRRWLPRFGVSSDETIPEKSSKEQAPVTEPKKGERPSLSEKAPSRVVLQDMAEKEERLEGMQPQSDPPENAAIIEPIRRLNSFDKQQEEDERDLRLDELVTPDEVLQPAEVNDMDASMSLQQAMDGSNSPPMRARLRSHDCLGADRFARLHELQQQGALGMHKSVVHFTEDKQRRFRELATANSAFENLSTSMSTFDQKRQARLRELQEIKAQKQGGAMSARERFEEKIKANKEWENSNSSLNRSNNNSFSKTNNSSFPKGESATSSQVRSKSMNPDEFKSAKPRADKSNRRHSISWGGVAEEEEEVPPDTIRTTTEKEHKTKVESQDGIEANPKTQSNLAPASDEHGHESSIVGLDLGYGDINSPDRLQHGNSSGPLNASGLHDESTGELSASECNSDSRILFATPHQSASDLGDSGSTLEHKHKDKEIDRVDDSAASGITTEEKPVKKRVSQKMIPEKPGPRRLTKGIVTPKNEPRFGSNTPRSQKRISKKGKSGKPKGRRASMPAVLTPCEEDSTTDLKTQGEVAASRSDESSAKPAEAIGQAPDETEMEQELTSRPEEAVFPKEAESQPNTPTTTETTLISSPTEAATSAQANETFPIEFDFKAVEDAERSLKEVDSLLESVSKNNAMSMEELGKSADATAKVSRRHSTASHNLHASYNTHDRNATATGFALYDFKKKNTSIRPGAHSSSIGNQGTPDFDWEKMAEKRDSKGSTSRNSTTVIKDKDGRKIKVRTVD